MTALSPYEPRAVAESVGDGAVSAADPPPFAVSVPIGAVSSAVMYPISPA